MDFNFEEHQDKLVRKLFKNVANTSEIRKVILAAKLPFTLLKPQLVRILWYLVRLFLKDRFTEFVLLCVRFPDPGLLSSFSGNDEGII